MKRYGDCLRFCRKRKIFFYRTGSRNDKKAMSHMLVLHQTGKIAGAKKEICRGVE